MSKLDTIFEKYTNMLKGYEGEKLTAGEAKQEIIELMLEIVGEDERPDPRVIGTPEAQRDGVRGLIRFKIEEL